MILGIPKSSDCDVESKLCGFGQPPRGCRQRHLPWAQFFLFMGCSLGSLILTLDIMKLNLSDEGDDLHFEHAGYASLTGIESVMIRPLIVTFSLNSVIFGSLPGGAGNGTLLGHSFFLFMGCLLSSLIHTLHIITLDVSEEGGTLNLQHAGLGQ